MKNKNESLLVAISLFFVVFLAPFNLMKAFLKITAKYHFVPGHSNLTA